jgi:hypothetical protein
MAEHLKSVHHSHNRDNFNLKTIWPKASKIQTLNNRLRHKKPKSAKAHTYTHWINQEQKTEYPQTLNQPI